MCPHSTVCEVKIDMLLDINICRHVIHLLIHEYSCVICVNYVNPLGERDEDGRDGERERRQM